MKETKPFLQNLFNQIQGVIKKFLETKKNCLKEQTFPGKT